jgi:hypothetical protein
MTSKPSLLLILAGLILTGFPGAVPTVASAGNQVTFIRTDTSTQGSWNGAYGLDGYVFPDPNTSKLPGYVLFTPQNQSNWTWTSDGTAVRDLQVSSSTDLRQASCWYSSSSSSYDLDVNITDGNTHQLALYLLDWDNRGRVETIQGIDGTTGVVLDTQNASNFSNGVYYVWNVSGHVKFNITLVSGINAVVSGAFFDVATANTASGIAYFVGTDNSTQGNWRGVYGADGYAVVGDEANTPAYAAFVVQNELNWTWASNTTDSRALQLGSGSGRIAATWYNSPTFSIDVNVTDGNSHQFALYAVDWDNRGRTENIQVVDGQTNTVLDSRGISNFTNGSYVIWNISGHVKLNVTCTGGVNAVISGAFFGGGGSTPAPAPVTTPPSASLSLPSGLLLRWTFGSNSISGNTVTDSSSNNQTGTIYGNPVSVAGMPGQALQFNGTNSYVTTLVGAPFTGNITLAAWINTTNKSRPEAIVSRYDAAGSGTGYIFRTDAAGHIEVVFGGANGGSINSPAVDTAVINDGQWHHVLAVIMVGQGVQFYVDGKPTAYVPQSFWAGDAPGYFYVGLDAFTYFGNFFTGSIDEVQAYNRALSPSEAAAVYAGTLSGSGSGGSGSNPTPTPTPPSTGTGSGNPTPLPAINAVSFNGIDTTTQGAWKGVGNFKASPASSSLVYGKDGVILPDTESCDRACNPFPSYVSFGPQAVNSSTPGNLGAKPYSTHAFVALVQGSLMGPEPGNPTNTNFFQCNYTFSNPAVPWAPMVAWTPSVDTREISQWNTCLGITTYYLELTFSGTHNFEVYVVDDQNGGTQFRSEEIQVLDGDTNAVLYDSGSFTNFTGGVYYKWSITGHVKVKVINTSTDGTDAVINGAFFN